MPSENGIFFSRECFFFQLLLTVSKLRLGDFLGFLVFSDIFLLLYFHYVRSLKFLTQVHVNCLLEVEATECELLLNLWCCSACLTIYMMQAINEKILSLGCGDFRAEITTVDSQESYNGGVLVLVTGYLTGSDNNRQKFTQSFFLAPQDNGYFVLNDVFRFVDDAKHQNGNLEVISSVEAPPTPNQGTGRANCLIITMSLLSSNLIFFLFFFVQNFLQ